MARAHRVRAVIALVCVVAIVAQPAARASDPAHIAVTFAVSDFFLIQAETKMVIVCNTDDVPVDSWAVAYEERFPDGQQNGHVFHFGFGKSGAYARAAGQDLTVVPEQTVFTSGPLKTSVTLAPFNSAEVRFAAATWGASADCTLTAAGEDVAMHYVQRSRAVMLTDEDFEDGAGARVTSTVASLARTYSRDATGFLAAVLSFDGGTVSGGILSVVDPSGRETTNVVPIGDLQVHESTPGAWQYRIDASVTQGSAGLWILDLPL